MTRLEREGKHPVEVGDYVHVEGSNGEQGWHNARVIRFWTDAAGKMVADVTKPRQAGSRVVGVARLTKQHTVR